MKINVEAKVSIEVQERRMVSWIQASRTMAEIVKKKNDNIRKTKEIMAAFEEAGLTSAIEPEEAPSKGCCIVS